MRLIAPLRILSPVLSQTSGSNIRKIVAFTLTDPPSCRFVNSGVPPLVRSSTNEDALPFSDGTEDKTMPDNALLTVDEVAERLRLSRNKVYDLIHAHEIPHIRLGRKFRIPNLAFEKWIESASVIENPDPVENQFQHRLVS